MTIAILDEMIGHTDPIVSEAAGLLKQFTQQLQDGEMTKEEFVELSRNLLDMKRINELTDDIDRKVAISQAFQLIYNAISTFGTSLL